MREALVTEYIPIAHPTQVRVECPYCEHAREMQGDHFDKLFLAQGPNWICHKCFKDFSVKARKR